MKTVYGQAIHQLKIFSQSSEVRGQHQFHPAAFKLQISLFECLLPGGRELRDENRLVDLEPFDGFCTQLFDQLPIHRSQSRQQAQFIDAILTLPESEVRERAENDRLCGFHTARSRFANLVEKICRVEMKRSTSIELRHNVVIIRVKPFRHFAGRHSCLTGSGSRPAARDAKVVVEWMAGEIPKTNGQTSQQKTHVENVIVEREIAGRNEIERGLLAPVSPPQFRTKCKQIFSGTIASPI